MKIKEKLPDNRYQNKCSLSLSRKTGAEWIIFIEL
jgi:hypothetical protein